MDYMKLRIYYLFKNLCFGRINIQTFLFTVPELLLGGGAGAFRGGVFFFGGGLFLTGVC